jgi:uncharacterized protein
VKEKAMSEETRSSKLLIAGASVPIVEGVAAIMHGGAIGAIVALGVSGLVYVVADEMEERGKAIALPRLSLRKREGAAGGKNKRGFLYRAFTPKDMREEDEEDLEDEPDMYSLDLAPDFRPHVNSILSHRTVILGQPGSGKSNAVADLVEELCQFEAPLIIFDSKPEYARLCAEPFMTNPFPVEPGSITPANARLFAYKVLDERLQTVIDLTAYRNATTAAQVMCIIVQTIMDWETQYVPNVLPVTIVLDEAHRWFPQQQNLSSVEKSVSLQLLQTSIDLVTGGRSLGMASIIATQRPQNIDKRIISVTDWYFLLRASYPNDLKVYRDLAGADPEMIQALANGEVLVKDVETGKYNGVYQFRRRSSPDDAKTPGIENLALSHAPITPFPSSQERCESPVKGVRESVINQAIEPRESTFTPQNLSDDRERSVKGVRESILVAIEELEQEGKPLTINRIRERAKLTWRQADEIEEVAIWAGYDLVRGQGRPKEG